MRWIVLASAYAILWFLALQMLLPIGIKSSHAHSPAVLGEADPGAPHQPRIGLKILLETIFPRTNVSQHASFVVGE